MRYIHIPKTVHVYFIYHSIPYFRLSLLDFLSHLSLHHLHFFGCFFHIGILGNSLDTTTPSWQVIAENINNFIGAGVSSAAHPDLNDYPYILAANDEWHQITMTYSGVENAEEQVFSLLKLYVDGVPQMGNARADKGECKF